MLRYYQLEVTSPEGFTQIADTCSIESEEVLLPEIPPKYDEWHNWNVIWVQVNKPRKRHVDKSTWY